MINNLKELNDKVNALVNYVMKTACEKTSSGQYYVSVDDACNAVEMSHEDFLLYKELIISEMYQREELLDCDFLEDSMEFDVNCALNYCPNYEWCYGDEDVFGCSYEKWCDEWEALPVSQPLSMSQMTEIAVNAVEVLKCVSFDREWHNQVFVESLGFGPKEAAAFKLENGLDFDELADDRGVKRPLVGSITYHDNNEVVEYTDAESFLKAYAGALYCMGPTGCTAKVLNEDLRLRYEVNKLIYNEFVKPIEPFDEWKAKVEALEKPALDDVISSCEEVSKKADGVDINQYKRNKEER